MPQKIPRLQKAIMEEFGISFLAATRLLNECRYALRENNFDSVEDYFDSEDDLIYDLL